MTRPTDPAAIVLRLYTEGLNRGDAVAAASLYAEDALNHGRPVGRAGMRAVFDGLLATFPDLRFEVLQTTAEDDRVTCHVVMCGTHLGEPTLPTLFQGALCGVAPTGRTVRVDQIHLFRVCAGLIGEHEAVRDHLGMLTRGAGPQPTEAGPRPRDYALGLTAESSNRWTCKGRILPDRVRKGSRRLTWIVPPLAH